MNNNQPLSKAPIDATALVKINEAVGVLNDYGYNTANIMQWLAHRMEEQRAQPTAVDRLWPWAGQAQSITEHLVPNATELVKSSAGTVVKHTHGNAERPTLSCRLQVGRAYELTPGQRDGIRGRFNMTPGPLVEVIELAMYADGVHIRRVTLKSVEHVDPRRRALMTKFSIDAWGQFCADAKQRDLDRAEAKAKAGEEDDDGTEPKASRTPSGKSKPSAKVNLTELMSEYGVD